MKKVIKLFVLVLCLFLIISSISTFVFAESARSVEKNIIYIPSVEEVLNKIFQDFEYNPHIVKEEIKTKQQEICNYIEYLSIFTKEEIAFNNERAIKAASLIKNEIARCEEIIVLYEQNYQSILQREEQERIEKEKAEKWAAKEAEYPVAAAAWKHMKENMGYSDAVTAGILGNMMAECGGQTLNLDWDARNASGHYGLCQWSRGYRSVQNASLEEQLNFMTESFPDAIDTWGPICYKSGFKYEDFLAMDDASEVAYAFCVIYERPGPGSYSQRRDNAKKALEYFTS